MARPRNPYLLALCILAALTLAAYCLLTSVDHDDFPRAPTSTIEDIADLVSVPSFILEIPIYRFCESLLRFLTRQQGEFTGLKEKALECVFGGTWWLLCSLQWFALLYFPLRMLLSVSVRREQASSAAGPE